MRPPLKHALSFGITLGFCVLAFGSLPGSATYTGKLDAGAELTYEIKDVKAAGDTGGMCEDGGNQTRQATCRIKLPNHGAHTVDCGEEFVGWNINSCYAFNNKGLAEHVRTGNACSKLKEYVATPTERKSNDIHNMDFSRTIEIEKRMVLGKERTLHCHTYEEGDYMSVTCWDYEIGPVSYTTSDMCTETQIKVISIKGP